MELNTQEKLERIAFAIDQMALIGYRFDELLEGFKLYDKNKGTLDIRLYEDSLELFESAIAAMEEQLNRFHRLFCEVKDMLK